MEKLELIKLENCEKKVRNVTIDILKALGILLIILAHTGVNDWIMQIRNFDVPMMVILSALLAVKTYNKNKSGLKYIIKRIIRLAVPVWIFLVIFFVGSYLVNNLFNLNIGNYSFKTVLKSFLFIDGIGYVWIIRVYILAAIAISILMKIKDKIPQTMNSLYIYIYYNIYYI